MFVSLLIFIALNNKVINKVTGALVTMSIGRVLIVNWNYVSKFQQKDLLSRYTEEHHPAQVLLSIIVSSGLYWNDKSQATLMNVRTLVISFYHIWMQQIFGPPDPYRIFCRNLAPSFTSSLFNFMQNIRKKNWSAISEILHCQCTEKPIKVKTKSNS